MNPLLFFIFICVVVTVAYVSGNQIGYVNGYVKGKAGVSNIVRGEPP